MKKELHVGMYSTLITVVTDESIRKFSEISGDINPVHLDDAYAEKTIFKKRIAPGLQVASYISAVLANQLPGSGTIYLEQNIRFLKPVYIGDIIETKITIVETLKSDKFRLKTEQFNGLGEKVIDGEAVVKYLGE
jgi:3-hydroxybutyryl-CoA dehydratase